MISTQQAVQIWEDNVGDSGKAPTDGELAAYANAVIETSRPDIEKVAATGATPADLYNDLMHLLLDTNFSYKSLLLANDIKNLFGKSARKAAGIVDE